MTTNAIDSQMDTVRRHVEAFHTLMQQVDDLLKAAPSDLPSQYIAEIGIAMALRAARTPDQLRQFHVLWTLDGNARQQELLAAHHAPSETTQ